jgi:hypothetical protein
MLLALGLVALHSRLLAAATFTASLDRDMVNVGDSVTLTLTFSGAEPKGIPSPSITPNLQVEPGAVSRNFSIVNGQQSFALSQSFLLTPLQPGVYTIAPLQAEVDGRLLASQALKLTAVKAEGSGQNPDGQALAFLKLLVPAREIYLGEVVGLQLQLFIRDGVANADGILRSFEGLGGSPLKTEGFSVLKTACAQRRRVQVGNGIYNVATLVTALSPVKTGPLPVASINATLSLQLPETNRRRDIFSFFEHYQEKRVAVATDPETVTVLPLPPDAPPDFNGAVGSYTLSATAAPTNIAAGDPITVKIQIAGRGALDALALPDQAAWRDFKTYPATARIESTDPLQITGAKTFEEVVVPQNPGLTELPPVSFSYFDSEKKSYQTLKGPAFALAVRPGGITAVPANAAASRMSAGNPPSTQDIVPIKQRPGAFAQVAPPLLRQSWFVTLQSVPLLAWLATATWRRRTDHLARNPRLRRRRQVARLVHQGLIELRRAAAANQSDAFFATLFRLLQEQLGERLDLPASAITEAVIDEHLRPRGVPESTLRPLHELFQTCNLARYAPVNSSQELAAVIPRVETALRDLQRLTL